MNGTAFWIASPVFAFACGATELGAGDAGPQPVVTCSLSADVACDAKARPCVPHWPAPLSAYCPSGTISQFASSSHVAQKCASYDVVVAPAGPDTSLLYLYSGDGGLAAIVQMGNSGYQCLGGTHGLPFPGLCGANPSTTLPGCCPATPDQVFNCGESDSGISDATHDADGAD